MKKLLMIFVCFTIIVLNISAQQESVSAKIEWTGTTMQKIRISTEKKTFSSELGQKSARVYSPCYSHRRH